MSARYTDSYVSVSETVLDWIGAEFSPLRNAAKLLAKLSSAGSHKVSHRTTQGWLSRRHPPCSDSIEILAARRADLAETLQKEREKLRALLQ